MTDGKKPGPGIPKEPEARKIPKTELPKPVDVKADAKPGDAKKRDVRSGDTKPMEAKKPDAASASAKTGEGAKSSSSPSAVKTGESKAGSKNETGKPRSSYLEPTLQAVDALDCESVAIAICSDVRPLAGLAGVRDWRMCGRLSDLLRKGHVSGKAREQVLIPTLGMIPPKRIFLFGWGPRSSMLDGATEKIAWMVDVLVKAKVKRVAVALPEPSAMLLGLVDEHVKKPLGDKLSVVFGPDGLVPEKDTRPIPMPVLTGEHPKPA